MGILRYDDSEWKTTKDGYSRLLTTQSVSDAIRHVTTIQVEKDCRDEKPSEIILAIWYIITPPNSDREHWTGLRFTSGNVKRMGA